jgi:hypothetical protein
MSSSHNLDCLVIRVMRDTQSLVEEGPDTISFSVDSHRTEPKTLSYLSDNIPNLLVHPSWLADANRFLEHAVRSLNQID